MKKKASVFDNLFLKIVGFNKFKIKLCGIIPDYKINDINFNEIKADCINGDNSGGVSNSRKENSSYDKSVHIEKNDGYVNIKYVVEISWQKLSRFMNEIRVPAILAIVVIMIGILVGMYIFWCT